MSNDNTTIATQLAERIHAFRDSDLSDLTIEWARHAFIDTIGCALAGMAEQAPHILMAVPGIAEAPGPSAIWGTGRRTSMLDAVLVNGTASHALDYDDVAGAMGGHPSAMLIPTLIALGESMNATGRDLIVAYVVGYETMIRIARGVNFHHYDKGWHPTATVGIFGTTAAAARLARLSVEHTATALGMAASFAAGLKANFGTMTKPLHVGHAARDGLFAALMARGGFTANPAAFEQAQGFLNVFNGPDTYDVSRMLGTWYDPPECEGAASPSLKPYPCCGSTHTAIARMLALAETHQIPPDAVERIEVMPHARRLPHTNNPNPRTPLAAKFSIQYCVARALTDRAIRLEHFEEPALSDPAVRALLSRVTAQPHPDMPADGVYQWGAEVVVHMKDGRRLASRADADERFGPGGTMMSEAALRQKFFDCCSRILPQPAIGSLYTGLTGLADLTDLPALTALTRPPEEGLGARIQAA